MEHKSVVFRIPQPGDHPNLHVGDARTRAPLHVGVHGAYYEGEHPHCEGARRHKVSYMYRKVGALGVGRRAHAYISAITPQGAVQTLIEGVCKNDEVEYLHTLTVEVVGS